MNKDLKEVIKYLNDKNIPFKLDNEAISIDTFSMFMMVVDPNLNMVSNFFRDSKISKNDINLWYGINKEVPIKKYENLVRIYID